MKVTISGGTPTSLIISTLAASALAWSLQARITLVKIASQDDIQDDIQDCHSESNSNQAISRGYPDPGRTVNEHLRDTLHLHGLQEGLLGGPGGGLKV